jgi:hypothetical protein
MPIASTNLKAAEVRPITVFSGALAQVFVQLRFPCAFAIALMTDLTVVDRPFMALTGVPGMVIGPRS